MGILLPPLLRGLSFLIFALRSQSWSAAAGPSLSRCDAEGGLSIKEDDAYTYLSNRYVCLVLDRGGPAIVHLAGDFMGRGKYGRNVLAGPGITLETVLSNGTVLSPNQLREVGDQARVERVGEGGVSVRAWDGVAVEEVWTLRLWRGSRGVEWSSTGRLLASQTQGQQQPPVVLVRHAYRLWPSSIYGLYEHGVSQMKDQVPDKSFYSSSDPLPLLYSLGGHGPDLQTAGQACLTFQRLSASSSPTNLSAIASRAGGGADDWSTMLHDVMAAGEYMGPLHVWGPPMDSYADRQAVLPAGSTSWSSSVLLSPNDGDFPLHTLPPSDDDAYHGRNLPENDLRAFLTGIYASPVGNLCTHPNGVEDGYQLAQIATSIRFPTAAYTGMYNFFDPDNYLATAALLHSGQPFLQDQVRLVLERSGSFLSVSGQLPHHFKGSQPVYVAISGETMPGPNLFWVLSCLNYAKTTGDLPWLQHYMPRLRHASAFLFGLLDPSMGLLARAPGSLFIDVFVRNNFTSDTNAMLVGFFRELADAEAAVGNTTGASWLQSLSSNLSSAMCRHLWDHDHDDDHFVTQLNPDGSVHDKVDYDSNLIALAHGVAPSEEAARRALARVDGGQCTHGRATWVSEKTYDGEDVVGGGSTKDANCSMGRIAWFDALARRRYGDQRTFDQALLEPLIGDLLRWTWLHERYGCAGDPQTFRTNYYFEYPSVVAMMLREVRYGIRLGHQTVTVQPFGPTNFSYHIGNLHVDYSQEEVSLRLPFPPGSSRSFVLHGMAPHAFYVLSVQGQERQVIQASPDGVLLFSATLPADHHQPITVRRQHGNGGTSSRMSVDVAAEVGVALKTARQVQEAP